MKLTILTRLMIAYFTIFILVMVLGGYAILKLHQLNKTAHAILSIDNRILEYGEKMAEALLSQLRYDKKFLITADFTLYSQSLSARNDFDTCLAKVGSVVDTPEKRGSLEKIKAYFRSYQSLVENEMAHVKGRRPYANHWFEQEKGKVSDQILKELEILKDFSRHDIHNRMELLGAASTSALKFAIVISSVAIVLGVATSFFITRNITKPLSMLMEKTKEIPWGEFHLDLDISSPPEIAELTNAFHLMCDQLRTVDKMKSNFFSSMSHELRTPLTSMKEGTSLLLEGVAGALTEKQRKLLTIISEESNRLIVLVNSLLDLSKMEAGMMSYTFEKSNVSPLINKVLAEIGPFAEAKRIRLEASISPDLPLLKLDRERILQVLRNLIGNAIKFTPEGGEVKVSGQSSDGSVKVLVSDTGPGIPRESLSTIFDKFQQATLPGYQSKGTGLGLALVKHVISSHGGKVWAESEQGSGSTFIFVLPV